MKKNVVQVRRKVVKTVVASALALSVLANPLTGLTVNAESKAESAVDLRVMGTTDIHTNFTDYDYYQDKATVESGLSRTATIIKQAREEAPNNLLFDNGDLIQGTPLGDYKATVKPLKDKEVHPAFKAMKLLKYDGATLGNHEFNYGIKYLNEVLDDAPFPYVNANIYKYDGDKKESNDKNAYKPYTILKKEVTDKDGKKQTIKVGIIGLITPQIVVWDSKNLDKKLITKDIVKSAEKFIPKMKKEGADLVIALAHSGYGDTISRELEENAVYELSKVKDVSGIIFGHSHKVFPSSEYENEPGADIKKGTINGVAAIQSGNFGSHLGYIDYKLENVEGKWKIADTQSTVKAIYDTTNKKPLVEADSAINEALKKDHEATVKYVNTAVGKTTADINSYFALVQDDPSIQLVTKAQEVYVKKQIKGTKYAKLPVLSAGAPFKAGGRNGASYYTDIKKGTLAIKNVADLYVYPNTVAGVVVTGKDLKEWLEMSAGQFNQIDPKKTEPQELINQAFRTYNFDVIDGVTYEIDVTEPAKYTADGAVINDGANRIKNLKYKGKVVSGKQQFIVATNNYRASGQFPGVKSKKALLSYPDESRQVIINYIRSTKNVNPTADKNWSLSRIKDEKVKVTFTTSQNAKTAASRYGNISFVEEGKDGFATFNLDLSKPDSTRVQLLGINDFHGQLTYKGKVTENGKTRETGGAEYLAAYLKEREKTNPYNTLLVHAGDAVGASLPESALFQDEPTIEMLKTLGFDMATVGNHEFDEGVKEMLRLIKGGKHSKTGKFSGAGFPYVVANLQDSKTKKPILPPYAIKEVDGVKIGFIGVVYSDTPSIVTASGVKGVTFTDETKAINKYTKELKKKGVKTIVVLAHNPITSLPDGTSPTEELVDIANGIDDEVDVIFGAHNHKFANTVIDGKLIVQAYSYGTAFADVDLVIDRATGDVLEKKAEIVTTYRDAITPDSTIQALVEKYVAKSKPITEKVIGKTTEPLNRTTNPAGESALGNFIADVMKVTMKADFGLMNSGGIRNDLDAGDITWGEAFGIQPFGNDLVKVTLTGKDIKEVFEQQWQPTKTKILQVSGLKVEYDDSKAIGSRIVKISLPNGELLNETKTYTVAINNFMAEGGDDYKAFLKASKKVVGPTDLDAFVNYVKASKTPINAKIEDRIVKVTK